eukprot:9854293-Alexandrium_andersonii.AAC.1
MARVMRQRHRLFYEVAAGGSEVTGALAMAELQGWAISTDCANHDAQNALKWGLTWLTPETEETVRRLRVVVESLRNAHDLLQSHLAIFLSSHLVFVDESPADQEAFSVWQSLGLGEDVAGALAGLGLTWRADALQCNAKWAGDRRVFDEIHGVCLAPARFKEFTDSRWCTIGASRRSLVACLFLGLETWVGVARADPRASDFTRT